MAEQIHALVAQLAAWCHCDEWVMVGVLFLLSGFLLKIGAQAGLRFVAGNHLQIGELADSLLKLLEQVDRWQDSTVADRIELKASRPTETPPLYIDHDKEVCLHGKRIESRFNRRERRLIFKNAKLVDQVLAAQGDQSIGADSLDKMNKLRAGL